MRVSGNMFFDGFFLNKILDYSAVKILQIGIVISKHGESLGRMERINEMNATGL